jgi:hypothetical protein
MTIVLRVDRLSGVMLLVLALARSALSAEAYAAPAADTTVPMVPAPAMVQAEVDANVVNLMQQFLPQFRQLLKIELALLNRICQPSKEDRKRLQQAGDQSLKEAAKSFAEAQKKMMQGQWRHDSVQPDPRKIIREGLLKAVQQHLSAEQATRYQAELEKRKAHLKHVTIQNLVAKLDENLVLTAEQREKLTESLSRAWREDWERMLSMFMNGNQYLPNVADGAVTAILNETQKQLWRSAPKMEIANFGGFGWESVAVEDGAVELEVKEERQPAAGEPKEKD